jgi:hypothetical protein
MNPSRLCPPERERINTTKAFLNRPPDRPGELLRSPPPSVYFGPSSTSALPVRHDKASWLSIGERRCNRQGAGGLRGLPDSTALSKRRASDRDAAGVADDVQRDLAEGCADQARAPRAATRRRHAPSRESRRRRHLRRAALAARHAVVDSLSDRSAKDHGSKRLDASRSRA